MLIKGKTNSKKKPNGLDEAYKMVYEDLCKNHAHVMALFNGTLHRDDIHPTYNQVNLMIEDIVGRGKK